MKILITGVNGLIGNYLANTLLSDEKFTVVGIDFNESKIDHPRYTHLCLDLTKDDFDFISAQSIEGIVHLAQSRFYKEFPDKNADVFDVNVESTFRLLEAARLHKIRQFIYASSGGIYGFGKNVFSEEFTVKLNDNLGFYLSTKLMGEMLVHNYKSFFKTAIIRPFFVFGRNQNPNMLIPSLIRRVRNGETILLKGENGIRINPIHAQDASGMIRLLLMNEAEGIFNICGDEILSLKQIVEIIGNKTQIVPRYDVQPTKGNEDIIGDNQKIKSLGFKYSKSIVEEIENMCNYF